MHGPVAFRGGGFAPRAVPGLGAATLVGIVLLWQAGASAGWVDTRFLPPPLAIGRALWALGWSGELWLNLSASLQRLAIGWIVGTVAGIAVGFAVGLSTLARAPGMAVVSALFPIPKIALVPLFIIWFGIGEGSKVVTLAFGSMRCRAGWCGWGRASG
jgi:NitT/TauT family transport system permease protein